MFVEGVVQETVHALSLGHVFAWQKMVQDIMAPGSSAHVGNQQEVPKPLHAGSSFFTLAKQFLYLMHGGLKCEVLCTFNQQTFVLMHGDVHVSHMWHCLCSA